MKAEAADRLFDLRNGVDAILSIQIAMELGGKCEEAFENGLRYVAEHMYADMNAWMDEIEREEGEVRS